MKIATGNVITMAPAAPDWVVAFNIGGETDEIVCPIFGWATLVEAYMNDGTVTTVIEPAFLWGDMVWTAAELREHTPGISGIEIRAREITRALAVADGPTRPLCPLHDDPRLDMSVGCTCDA